MPIRVLSQLMINQIAAGEVVERPVSVVKELVENALDAGASCVTVELEEGGRDLIRVRDDGKGLPREELPLAVAPHATSKVVDPTDLEAIGSFGFRGEALASISSVSRFRMASAQMGAEEGWELVVSGDQLDGPSPVPSVPGTVVEVRDLFFNVPARRKFLKKAGTELGHISEYLHRVAMVRPEVGVRLIHGGRRLLDLPINEAPRERLVRLLGKGVADGLLDFSLQWSDDPGAPHCWGLAGVPDLAQKTAKGLYVFVNGRPVRDRTLMHATKEAYRGLMPMDKQPLAVVFLDMDPREVDVNVHPQKSEVRFRQSQTVYRIVRGAIREALDGSDLVPTLDPSAMRSDAPDLVRDFKRMDFPQKRVVYEQLRGALESEREGAANPLLPQGTERDLSGVFSSSQELRESASGAGLAEGDTAAWSAESTVVAQGSSSSPSATLVSVPILQFRNSYVVVEDEEGLLIVDQHALHERVMFEDLRIRVLEQQKQLPTQPCLIPEVVQVSAAEVEVLEELQPLLTRIGLELNVIGPAQIAVQSVPTLLIERKVELVPFVRELLGKAVDGDICATSPAAAEEALRDVLDMMSCKSAIKAGEKLSLEALSELLARRREIERSSSCPHGRPTTLRLTVHELEKRFGRS